MVPLVLNHGHVFLAFSPFLAFFLFYSCLVSILQLFGFVVAVWSKSSSVVLVPFISGGRLPKKEAQLLQPDATDLKGRLRSQRLHGTLLGPLMLSGRNISLPQAQELWWSMRACQFDLCGLLSWDVREPLQDKKGRL